MFIAACKDLRVKIPGVSLGKKGYSKITDDQTNGMINSVMKIFFLLSCTLFGRMNPTQNLRQERVFLAISDTRLSEQQFVEVLMHQVALPFFSREKEEGTSTTAEFTVIGRKGRSKMSLIFMLL